MKPFSEHRVVQCLRRLLERRSPHPGTIQGPSRIVARRKKSLVFLGLDEVWAIQAANRLAFIHTPLGRFDLDLSLTSIEATCGAPFIRVHRNWLVTSRGFASSIVRMAISRYIWGEASRLRERGFVCPLAKDAQQIRDALLLTAAGVRRPPG